MTEIFKAAIERGASDIHIKTGDVIRARIDGRLTALTEERMVADQVRALAQKLMPYERDRERIDDITDYDCSWGALWTGPIQGQHPAPTWDLHDYHACDPI